MVLENLKVLHAHFKKLSIEGGNTENQIRNDLVKSDAIKHLAELEEKYPEFKEVKKPIKPKEKD